MSGTRGRRNWQREWRGRLWYPFTMFEGKANGRRHGLSLFRVVLFTLTLTFVRHWPASPWGKWDWATLAVLVFAMPVSDLFAAVPAKELLATLTAIFAALARKHTPEGGWARGDGEEKVNL